MRIAWGSGRCLSDTSPRSSELFEYVIIESKCGEDAKGWNSDAISCCLSWEEKCFVDQAAIAAADPHQCLESRLPGVNEAYSRTVDDVAEPLVSGGLP